MNLDPATLTVTEAPARDDREDDEDDDEPRVCQSCFTRTTATGDSLCGACG